MKSKPTGQSWTDKPLKNPKYDMKKLAESAKRARDSERLTGQSWERELRQAAIRFAQELQRVKDMPDFPSFFWEVVENSFIKFAEPVLKAEREAAEKKAKADFGRWVGKELKDILSDIVGIPPEKLTTHALKCVIQAKYRTEISIKNLANMIQQGYGVNSDKAPWEKENDND